MEQRIYIGPTIMKLGLLRNQIYLDGIPGQVRAALVQYPEIEELIVSVEELDDGVRKTRTKGEHLHHVYTQLMEKAGKTSRGTA